MNDQLRNACLNGDLEIIKQNKADITKNHESLFHDLFLLSCTTPFIEISKWLYSLGTIKYKARTKSKTKRVTYKRTTYLTYDRKVLYKKQQKDKSDLPTKKQNNRFVSTGLIYISFRRAIHNGNLRTAQWLYSVEPITYYITNEYGRKDYFDRDLFEEACQYNNLETVKWLYSLNQRIYIDVRFGFDYAIQKGKTDIAEWLYSLGEINLYNNEDYYMTIYNPIESIRLLLKLDKFDNVLVNEVVSTHPGANQSFYYLVFKHSYYPTNEFMRQKYKEYLKIRAKYLWKLIKILVKILIPYLIKIKYSPFGSGYLESKTNFELVSSSKVIEVN